MRLTLNSDGLSPEQKSVVQSNIRDSVAVAGRAGTGKTTTAVHRLLAQLTSPEGGRRVAILTAFNHLTLFYMNQLLVQSGVEATGSVKIWDVITTNKLEVIIDNAFSETDRRSSVLICTNHILARWLERCAPEHAEFLVNRGKRLAPSKLTVQFIFDEAQSVSSKYVQHLAQLLPEDSEVSFLSDFYWDPNQAFESKDDADQDEVGGVSRDWFRPALRRAELLQIYPETKITILTTNHRNKNPVATVVDRISAKLPLSAAQSSHNSTRLQQPFLRVHAWSPNRVAASPTRQMVIDEIARLCQTYVNQSVGIVVLNGSGVDRTTAGVVGQVSELARLLNRKTDIRNRVIGYHSSVGASIRSRTDTQRDIWVMNVRSARGLEFDQVVVPNAFFMQSPNQELLREIYTAISRSINNLHVMTDFKTIGLVDGSLGLFDDNLAHIIRHP